MTARGPNSLPNGKMCGVRGRETFTVHGPTEVNLVFNTDGSETQPGYKIEYEMAS